MATNEPCGNCGDDYPMSKPKKRQKKGGKIYELGNLPNPIPEEVKDTEDIIAGFKEFEIVPYAGTTEKSGDSLLSFLIMLAELSPTSANCIQSIKKYAFGGGIDIQQSQGVFAFREKVELSSGNKEGFVADVLDSIDTPNTDLEALGECLYEDAKETGNEWLEIRLFTVANQPKASIVRHKPETARYKLTKKGEQRFVYISQKWDNAYLTKHKPELIPLYPAFAGDGYGVLRTIIHCKTGTEFWYGRPESMGSIIYQYREFQDAMYLIKQAANNFTGQVIIEVEDDNPEESNKEAQRAGFENEAHRMEENFTAQGDNPQSIYYSSRPYGSRPMFFTQVEPNTNENWYDVTGKIAEEKIIASFSWSKRFLVDDIGTGFSSEIFMDRLKTLIPVIRENQKLAAKPINLAIGEIVKWLGVEAKYKDYGIKYYSPYREILEETQAAEDARTDNSMGGNQGNASEE